MREYWPLILICSVIFSLSSCSVQPENESEDKKGNAINYYEVGKEIASTSQMALMKNVKAALQKGGPSYAVEYCNVHALPLLDSLSKKFDCKIERLALKNRNPTNFPKTLEEKKLLYNYLERSFENKTLNDTLLALNGELSFYQPIYLSMETCLKCHGKLGKDVNNETTSALHKIYPDDKAIDYRLGEFRGAWKITFNLN